jgi:hypothetical protein
MHKAEINWIGGEHVFALNIGELRALQDSCNAGPEQILHRITLGEWRIDDLFETLRLGLIGAGTMASGESRDFMTHLFDRHPLIRFRAPAHQVLAAALIGDLEDEPGKGEGVPAPLENGNSQTSTESAPSLDLPPPT